MGDGFFNRYYTFFDIGRNVVGIAKNKENLTLDNIINHKIKYVESDWIETLTTVAKPNPSNIPVEIKKSVNSSISSAPASNVSASTTPDSSASAKSAPASVE